MKRLAILSSLLLALAVISPAEAALAQGTPQGASSATAPSVASADTKAPGLMPVTPARLLDTRTSGGMVKSGGTVEVPVTGQGGIPSSGVSAVVVNVTTTGPTAPGYLTAYPTGKTRPEASSVNYAKAQTVANQAIVQLGTDGSFTLYASAATHALVDVTGYFPTGSAYASLSPSRILDTRTGNGVPKGIVATGGVVRLKVAGAGGVPASGAGAVVLNVTDTAPAGPGFVTAYPDGAERPLASTLNYAKAQTVAGMTIAKIGDGGYVDLYTSASSHLIADVVGWFPTTSDYTPLTPTRALDTRTGTTGRLKAGASLDLQVAGTNGIPATDDDPAPTAVEITVTATKPAAPGFVTTYPSGVGRPTVSTVNYVRAQTVANSATVGIGTDGKITLYSPADTDVIVDVVGYFSAPADGGGGGGGTGGDGYPIIQTITSGGDDSYRDRPSLNQDGSKVLYAEDHYFDPTLPEVMRAPDNDDPIYGQSPSERAALQASRAAAAAKAWRVAARRESVGRERAGTKTDSTSRGATPQADDQSGQSLRLYDAETGSTTTVLRARDLSDGARFVFYQLTADATAVFYTYENYDLDDGQGIVVSPLMKLDLASGRSTKVIDLAGNGFGQGNGDEFALSPDGRHLAYDEKTGETWQGGDLGDGESYPIEVTRVMVKDLSSGAAPTQVSEPNVSASVSSVAADGSAVAYEAYTQDTVDDSSAVDSEVWKRSTGARVSILPGIAEPKLSPDGTSAVGGGPGETNDFPKLYLWKSATNTVDKLTNEEDYAEEFDAWSGDGRYVAHEAFDYSADDDYDRSIRLWDTKTGRLTIVADSDEEHRGDGFQPKDATISNDGSHVGFLTASDQVALWGPNPNDPDATRALQLDEGYLPPATVGGTYSASPGARGGLEPYTWSAQDLPAGLSITSSTGIISGAPTEASEGKVTVSVRDSRGTMQTSRFDLTVYDAEGKATALTGDAYHCATLQSKQVWCWGGRPYDGSGVDTPQQVTNLPDDADHVVTTSGTGCVVTTSGQLWCWSKYDHEAVKDTTFDSPVSDVTLDYNQWCALLTNGTVECADPRYSEADPTPVALAGKAVALTGDSYRCALLATRAVQCFNADLDISTPVTIKNIAATSISAGFSGGCALTPDGAVRCWDNGRESKPRTIGGFSGQPTQLATDGIHGCATLSGGGVACWGTNDSGQLGNGTTDEPESATAASDIAGVGPALQVVAGDGRSCALGRDGTVSCWGAALTGDGTTQDRLRPVRVLRIG